MSSKHILVQTSINDREMAQTISDAIITQRLAACCWLTGPFSTTYWWKGEIVREQEWACTFKTRADLYVKLEAAIKSLHPYETPEIVATDIAAANDDYLKWIVEETTTPENP